MSLHLSSLFKVMALLGLATLVSCKGGGGAATEGSVFDKPIEQALISISLTPSFSSTTNTFSLDATSSSAPGKTFSWSQVSGPGTATFTAPTTEDTDVSVDAQGAYIVQVVVTTENGRSATASSRLIFDSINPVVNAGPDLNSNIAIKLTGASATDGSDLSHYWSMVSGPGTISFSSRSVLDPTISASADGAYTIRLTSTDPAGNSSFDDMILTWKATPPAVDVGADLVANSVTPINATATDSTAMTYAWSKVSGPGNLIFGSPSAEDTSISADTNGIYIARLTVTDSFGNSASDQLQFTWDTIAPVLNIGSASNARATFTTSASATDLTTMTYSWTPVSGPGVITFGSANALNTSVSASSDGNYTIRLTVTDQLAQSSSATLSFLWDATAPVVDASTVKTTGIAVGQFGSASDANPFTVAWSKVSGPGTVAFSSPTSVTTSISADTDGTYILALSATDSSGNVSFDTMTLVWDTSAPVVDAGTDKLVNAAVFQDATVTDTGVITYQWSKVTGPGVVTFGSATAEDTMISADTDGDYIIRLTATDDVGNMTFDEIAFRWDTTPPAVNAGVDAYRNTSVNQNATVSDIHSYTLAWSKVSGPGSVVFSSSTIEDPNISVSTEGVYVLRLTATDAAGNSAFDDMTYTFDTTAPAALSVFSGVTSTSIETGRIDLNITYPADTSDYLNVVIRRSVSATAPTCSTGTVIATITTPFNNGVLTDPTNYPGGFHSYRACITDRAGNQTSPVTQNIKANKTHRIFQTSSDYSGNLRANFDSQVFATGLEGANYRCQYHAGLAGLTQKFVAVLSDSTINAIRKVAVNGRIYATNDLKIADNRADLWDSAIINRVNVDEDGLTGANARVWSGSDGAGAQAADHCLNWTSALGVDDGGIGDSSRTDGRWINDGKDSCDRLSTLYCISQIDIPSLNSFSANTGAASGQISTQVILPASTDVKYYSSVVIYRLFGGTAPSANCNTADGSTLVRTHAGPFTPSQTLSFTDNGIPGFNYSYRACIIDEDGNQVGSRSVSNVAARI